MRKIILALAGVVAGGLVAVAFHQAKAQPTKYDFMVPRSALTVAVDRAVGAGKNVGESILGNNGCTAGTYGVQGMVMIASNGSGGARHHEVYSAPGTEVPPATKLGTITENGTCYDTVKLITFYKYTGTVQ